MDGQASAIGVKDGVAGGRDGFHQQNFYKGQKYAAGISVESFHKQYTMLHQQNSATSETEECPGTGHW